jgi:hypothetical protein
MEFGRLIKNNVKSLIQSKAFDLGFTLGLLASIIFTYFSYLRNVCSDGMNDCGWSFGFPVHLYMEGGFISFKKIIWLGFFTDILFALTFSLLIGSVFKFPWSKITPRRLT